MYFSFKVLNLWMMKFKKYFFHFHCLSCLSLGLLSMKVLTGLMLRLKNSCEHTASFCPYITPVNVISPLYVCGLSAFLPQLSRQSRMTEFTRTKSPQKISFTYLQKLLDWKYRWPWEGNCFLKMSCETEWNLISLPWQTSWKITDYLGLKRISKYFLPYEVIIQTVSVK